MMDSKQDIIYGQIDALDIEYKARFEEHHPATRDPKKLQFFIDRLRSIQAKVDLPENEQALQGLIRANLDTYERKQREIELASRDQALVSHAKREVEKALILARYRRQKDKWILRETITGLQSLGEPVAEYEEELKNIEEDATSVERANAMIQMYQHFFVNKTRISRSPERLQHMILSMKEILDQMLDEDGRTKCRSDNISIVKEAINAYEEELKKIISEQESEDIKSFESGLAHSANNVVRNYDESFAGRDRVKCDLVLLSRLADELGDIRKHFIKIKASENISIITDNLLMIERGYAKIATA